MIVIGDQRPRLSSIPPHGSVTRGSEIIDFAAHAGLYLDDWQQYVLTEAMWRQPDGKWAAFEVCVIVSRQNGKGSILEARELAGLYLFETERLLIHTAHEHKTSAEHYLRIWSLIEQSPDLRRKVVRHSSAYGREFIELKAKPTIIIAGGGKYIRRAEKNRLIFIARSGGSGRGFTGDFLAYDEDMILDAEKVSASMPSLFARPNPQIWYMGSAGLKTSTQLGMLRRRGVAGDSPSLFFAEWSINAHDEYCDPHCRKHDNPDLIESVAKANPGLGIRITAEMLERAREAFRGNEVGYNREVLGVGEYPAPSDGWLVIPQRWWTATTEDAKEPPRLTSPIFSIDVARDRSSSAIGVAGMRPDGFMGIELVEHRSGTKWIVPRVLELQEAWHPTHWVIDARAAAGSLETELTKAGITIERLQARDVANASGLIFDAFRDSTLRHLGQSAVRTALAGADKRPLSESWAFDRRNVAVDLTPLLAVTFALWGYQEFGVCDYDAGDSVHLDLAEILRMCRAGVYTGQDIRRLYDETLLTDTDLETLANAGFIA